MRTVWVLQHDDAEPAGLIQTVLRRSLDPAFVTLRPDRQGVPEKLGEECSALIVMGGPMGVYEQEKFPWIAGELALIREAIETARPVLAVCLGSQLLAAAAGANVYKGEADTEIGWGQIKLTPEGHEDPLARFLANPATGDATTVFQWHGDTFDLPPGAVLLATSTRYPQQAFRSGRVAYGFQFHFEITEQIVRHWAQLWHRQMAAEGVTADDLFSGLKEHLPVLNRRGEEIVRAFGALIVASPLRALPATNPGESTAARRRRLRIEPRLDESWIEEEKNRQSGKASRLQAARQPD
jgi:GMP synthase-like glutamine amidotransferase